MAESSTYSLGFVFRLKYVHYLNKVEIGNPCANGTSIAKEVSL
jgi:hypothetical protein